MKRLLQRVDEPVKLIKPSEKQEEKSAEIVYVLLGMTALYYGLGLVVFLQTWLLLEGVRNQSEYSISSSYFWVDFVIMSFPALMSGGFAGLLVGFVHGYLISFIYHKNVNVSSQPELFKRVVYSVNLLIPLVFITVLFAEAAKRDLSYAIEDIGLGLMASCAVSFLISRRFWRWGVHGTTTPST